MTARHYALMNAFSRLSHFAELGDNLNLDGNNLTPAQRRALAMLNLTNDFLEITPSGLVTPGAGITSGVGTVVESHQVREGKLLKTRIFIDLTGLAAVATDLDVIGATGAAYIGQITTAAHGAPCTGRMICLEAPATGSADIDLYSATVATAVAGDGIAALTETAHVTAGGAWTAGLEKVFALGVPADNYLYLVNGAASGAGTYTAGKFLIEIEGSTF